ncbi:MAG: 6-carboxytetrahydropterin synthase [bacterium]|nr:6-carboxytetrahydropterin synthase [bacterium]
MSVTTCKKIYSDIPWAHRQHRHDGHCALLHGHNWSIAVTFGCSTLDENGFVVDFGKLKFLKNWIDENLDHACVLNRDDPMREALVSVGGTKVWKPYVVDCCSCEGMAKHVFEVFNSLVQSNTAGRARVESIEVVEDSKNSAAYSSIHSANG